MAAKKNQLIRDPEDWARAWGWVSRRRALAAAARLRNLATELRDEAPTDEWIERWADEAEALAKYLAPKTVPAQRAKKRQAAAA